MKKFSALGNAVDKVIDNLPSLDHLPDEDPDGRCPKCDGYGHIIDERGARPCECVTSKIVLDAMQDARVPRRYLNESLETFSIENSRNLRPKLKFAMSYVANYSEDNYKGLYIHGPTGVGKTHLAIGILKGLIEKKFSGAFYNLSDLFDILRSTYDPQIPGPSKSVIEEQLSRQILILDDFGVTKSTSWSSERLYALINRRYQNCQTLIVTSNIPLNKLSERLEESLVSRIRAMCHELKIDAQDFRSRP